MSAAARAAPRRPANSRASIRRAPARKPLGDRIVDALPISHETLRRLTTWTLLGVGAAVALAVAGATGLIAAAGNGVADLGARAGLRVEGVDITGLKRMDRETVYAIALEDQSDSRAILRVDLDRVRQRLLGYGWIADAQVSRRLPDRLLVHVVERTPAAVWQDNGQLTLIDAEGHLLAPVSRDAMPDLPLVIGPGADRQEADYHRLLAAAPALRGRVKAAAWVGDRRWDLTFDTGETLALPQDGAGAALAKFAAMERAQALLGRGWLRFDMRVAGRMYARRPGQDARERIDDDGRASDPPAAGGNGAAAAAGTEDA